jgi:hypothetical protein
MKRGAFRHLLCVYCGKFASVPLNLIMLSIHYEDSREENIFFRMIVNVVVVENCFLLDFWQLLK